MKVVLINPYELGRQPFALAQPAAWLKEAGHQVCCLELSLQQLDDVALGHAELVAVYVGMHTAARIAAEASLSANLTETPAPLGITVGRWR